eukprot:m.34607 g.34607  ORF g.34607 m.34607 type:complete len:322 (+) comp8754_c0_seq1:335-1300(+)
MSFETRTFVLLIIACFKVHAQETVSILPSDDATISSEVLNGADGSSIVMFSGNNDFGFEFRTLIKFDVAGALPSRAIAITDATITLRLNRAGNSRAADTTDTLLRRLTRDWAEGDSATPLANTGVGGGGGLPNATTGDVTWENSVYDSVSWTTPGGDFDVTPSASLLVDPSAVSLPADFTWTGGSLAADVQDMSDNAATNFGWILMNEGGFSKRWNSLQAQNTDGGAPILYVEFVPCEITCPPYQAYLPGSSTDTVITGLPTVTDECSQGITITHNDTQQGCFAGSVERTFTVTLNNGEQLSCSHVILLREEKFSSSKQLV